MGRKVNTPDILSRTPVYVSSRQDFNVGTSFTTTETLIDITGAGVIGVLALYNTQGVLSTNTLHVMLDIDGARACSATLSVASGVLNVIGSYIEDGGSVYDTGYCNAFDQIPFKSSFKFAVKSIGQEQSLSLRGVISYRTV